jgi:hypothetical protein
MRMRWGGTPWRCWISSAMNPLMAITSVPRAITELYQRLPGNPSL